MSDIARDPLVQKLVELTLLEDLGDEGDVTSKALVDPKAQAKGCIFSRVPCVVSGASVAKEVFRQVCRSTKVQILIKDGQHAAPNEPILEFSGKARHILAAERTALNFMQRLCATATLTNKFVEATRPYGTLILDTRKTTPLLRQLQKYAVTCGGGSNHRMGLYDRILMKDNHRRLWRGGDPNALDQAVLAARKKFPHLAIEVEVESIAECQSALRAAPEWIMLDNMSCDDMAKCVKLCDGISLTEASGGITLDRAVQVAQTGVTAISLGCLTHSPGSIDLSLEWEEVLSA